MCPVRAAAEVVKRIHSYNIPKDKIRDTPLFLIKIRAAVKGLGHEKLGFYPEEVGTHSNHSGGAMGMLLAGTPVYTIMLMGHWSLEAFMRYL
jgi:hypothetical protein